jgi:hypothetical protein
MADKRAAHFKAIERGNRALALNPSLAQFAAERRIHIVAQLVSRYRSRQLTDQDLWGAVGALAELDDMQAAIERDVTAKIIAEDRERGTTE